MIARTTCLATILCAPLCAQASDGIATTGMLSDGDFLALVTCGAIPDGPCQTDAARWSYPGSLTVGFGPVPDGYPAETSAQIETALDAAITTLNAAGSAIRLTRNDAETPDITLRPTMFNENDVVTGEPGIADGTIIGAGYVFVYNNENLAITDATIVIAQDIPAIDIPSIVLEELTQALGFTFDIENPAYENVSVFAQDSNTVLQITGQDAAILRLYYPGEP